MSWNLLGYFSIFFPFGNPFLITEACIWLCSTSSSFYFPPKAPRPRCSAQERIKARARVPVSFYPTFQKLRLRLAGIHRGLIFCRSFPIASLVQSRDQPFWHQGPVWWQVKFFHRSELGEGWFGDDSHEMHELWFPSPGAVHRVQAPLQSNTAAI